MKGMEVTWLPVVLILAGVNGWYGGLLKLITLVGWFCRLNMLELLDGFGGDGYPVCWRSWLDANQSV